MKQNLPTTEIFTPAKPAVNAFVEREFLNNQLVDSLKTPGKQIVIFGQTGSGKTTLLYNKLNQTYEGNIVCRCTQLTTFDQILIDAFDQLENFYISEKNNTRSKKLTARLQHDFKVIKGEIKSELGVSNGNSMLRVIPPQLTPSRLAKFIGEISYCWVIEDVHKISKEEKIKVSQVMKVFMDSAVDYPELKMILVGAVGTAKEIISLERDMRNRTIEIPVPLMTQKELKELVSKGENLLNIGLEYSLKEAITKFSCGLPSVTHQLCLNICLNKNIYETCDYYTELTLEDFTSALKKYVFEISDSLKCQFESITNSNHETNLLIETLKSILFINKDLVSKTEVKQNLNKRTIRYENEELERSLKHLSGEHSENILNFDPVSGEYSFLNPFFKVYCYCNVELENYTSHEQLKLDFLKKTDKNKEMVRLILKNGGYSDIDF